MYTHDSGFWNVFSDLDRLFDSVGRNVGATRRGTPFLSCPAPALNVWGNDEALLVTSELPGVEPASIGITVHGDTLTVKGKRVLAPAQEQQAERSAEFERSLQLPYRVDADKTQAHCRDGVLSVTLHRLAADKPRAISITAA
jgi:HSP20 family protein